MRRSMGWKTRGEQSIGHGHGAHRDDMLVAGKSGTVQATAFLVAKLDEKNKPILDETGKPDREPLTPSTHTRAPPIQNHPHAILGIALEQMTLPRGKILEQETNSTPWFIGFVPAGSPCKFAISVMVEYGGGGGGVVAGPMVNHIIDALIKYKYLEPEPGHHPIGETLD